MVGEAITIGRSKERPPVPIRLALEPAGNPSGDLTFGTRIQGTNHGGLINLDPGYLRPSKHEWAPSPWTTVEAASQLFSPIAVASRGWWVHLRHIVDGLGGPRQTRGPVPGLLRLRPLPGVGRSSLRQQALRGNISNRTTRPALRACLSSPVKNTDEPENFVFRMLAVRSGHRAEDAILLMLYRVVVHHWSGY
ncbi:hypothetical protein LIA77_01633 [Sarocladium implicatum]|nr:hypothetical protein LIA77_01633 [Sarocladium implicatum]